MLRRSVAAAVRWLQPRAASRTVAGAAVGEAVGNGSFARYERLSFVSRRPVRAGLGGEHRSRKRAPSTDFVDYRPYHPGDDFRRVDWNVYGRLGSLQVKLTEGRERLELTLVLDCSASMAWGQPDKLSFAAQLVAALAYVGLARYDAVRVVRLGEQSGAVSLGPLRGRARFAEVVNVLSSIGGDGRVDLASRLGDALPGANPNALVILVSDLLVENGVADGLDALRQAGADVILVHVISNAEQNPDLSGELELVDAETEDVLEVGLSLDAMKRYRQRYDEWLGKQETACAERGLRYVRVRSDRSVDTAVMDDMRRAGVLR